MVRRRIVAWFAVLPLAFAAAFAQDARTRSVAEDLKAARYQMKLEHWAAAAKAFATLFVEHPRDPDLLRAVGDIEGDLALCTYRAQAEPPSTEELLGPDITSFTASTRKIVLTFAEGPQEPQWTGVAGMSGTLAIPFEGDITVDFQASAVTQDRKGAYYPRITLCWDAEKGTGYQLEPGYYEDLSKASVQAALYFTSPSTITRLDGKDVTKVLQTKVMANPPATPGSLPCRATRGASALAITSDGKIRATASDSRYSKGLVAVSAAKVWDLEIRGTVEEVYYRARLGSFHERRFRKWMQDSWKPQDLIPDWAREGGTAAPTDVAAELPSDSPIPTSPAVTEALQDLRAGNLRAFLDEVDRLKDVPGRTGVYLQALGHVAAGRNKAALDLLGRVLEDEPSFAPAKLYRGVVRLRLRDLVGAGTDLLAARDSTRSSPDLYLALASRAVQEGDIDGAWQILGDAKAAGAWNPSVEKMYRVVQTCRTGPPWPKKFETRNRGVLVQSDHSLEMARQVAHALDQCFAVYAQEFHGTSRPAFPLRVLVFSHRDGFLAHAADLGQDLANASGAYFPALGELVLFVPDLAREEFRRTIRHEAFHAFLDGVVEGVPDWFNEGYAQWFESAREREGKFVPGADNDAAFRILRAAGTVRAPKLAALLRLDHEAFRAAADVDYAESWAFVQFLQELDSPSGRGLLLNYLDSLRAGLAPSEAHARHWEPVLGKLETRFSAWLAARYTAGAGK
jgi:hypothetical protein